MNALRLDKFSFKIKDFKTLFANGKVYIQIN